MEAGPFEGVRVLDVGRYISAPFCAAMLADMGADVIRLEPIEGSDDRTVMPVGEACGALHLHVNHSKRSLALDLRRAEARPIFERLVGASDIVVTNMPGSALARLRLDYQTLKSINARIIHTNITAYGDVGPERDSIGFDGIGQALSGAIHLSGWPGQPTRSATSYVDYGTAMASAFATAAALYERMRTGQGQEVKTSLLRTALTIMNPILIEQALDVRTRMATGNRSPIAGPSDIFKTTDGWIIVQVIGRDMFQRWTSLIGRPELLNDPRFTDDIKRGENGEALSALMQVWCSTRSSAACLAELRAARVPSSQVLSPKDALAERQSLEGGLFAWVASEETSGKIPIVAPVLNGSPRGLPPTAARPLGADTREILVEVGYSQSEIDAFINDRIVAIATSNENLAGSKEAKRART
jgi:crotonobetainyl-CoA:carnitine CoA-transferase CaiB-like acyl-CoA transferase